MGRAVTKCRPAPSERCELSIGEPELETTIVNYRPALVAYFARRVSSPEEAEDLAHEVLIRLLGRQTTANITEIRPYVFEVAKNVLIDRGRRNRVRCTTSHEPLSDAIPDADHPECERAIMAREQVERVRTSLLELPDRTRSIFILRRLEGMKHQEIAGNLGVSLSTVEKHVRLAVLHLKGCLESTA
jgi:RNA polymerase sigma factor (sigma-70 family)